MPTNNKCSYCNRDIFGWSITALGNDAERYCSYHCAFQANPEKKKDTNPKDGVGIQDIQSHRMEGYSMRNFDTGATRDGDTTKFDYDGYLSPYTLRAFGEYMHKHQIQSDGSLRASDNWQKGMPIGVYRKSMWRHFMDTWAILRGHPDLSGQATDQGSQDILESLCGLYFNVGGLIHEISKKRRGENA